MDYTDARRTAIRECPLFEGLDEKQISMLQMHARTRRFSEGEFLYQKGQEAHDTFRLIVLGSVHVLSDAGQVVQTLRGRQVVGEIGVVSPRGVRTLTVRAAEPTEVLEWRFSQIKEGLPDLRQRLKDLAWRRSTDRHK